MKTMTETGSSVANATASSSSSSAAADHGHQSTKAVPINIHDKDYNYEEKLIAATWIHDRYLTCKSFDDIRRDFEARFHKTAPNSELMMMWEHNAFNTGSVDRQNHSSSRNQEQICSNCHNRMDVKDSASSSSSHNYHGHHHSHHHHHHQNNNYNQQSSTHGHHHLPPRMNNFYKTEICKQFDKDGRCDFGDACTFAHGRHELKQIPGYKTRLCASYHQTGHCQYGNRCIFVHHQQEAQTQLFTHDFKPNKINKTKTYSKENGRRFIGPSGSGSGYNSRSSYRSYQ